MTKDIWTPIVGTDGKYEVCTNGNIRNSKTGRILRPAPSRRHLYVSICGKTRAVHGIVAKAFIPNPMGYTIINHKDENPYNNDVSNLEYCTQKYNVNYGTAKERKIKSMKESGYCKGVYADNGSVVKFYESLSECAKELKINVGNIQKVCSGERKTAGGYRFYYA